MVVGPTRRAQSKVVRVLCTWETSLAREGAGGPSQSHLEQRGSKTPGTSQGPLTSNPNYIANDRLGGFKYSTEQLQVPPFSPLEAT